MDEERAIHFAQQHHRIRYFARIGHAICAFSWFGWNFVLMAIRFVTASFQLWHAVTLRTAIYLLSMLFGTSVRDDDFDTLASTTFEHDYEDIICFFLRQPLAPLMATPQHGVVLTPVTGTFATAPMRSDTTWLVTPVPDSDDDLDYDVDLTRDAP